MKRYLSLIERKLHNFYGRISVNTSLTDLEISFYRIFLGFYFLLFRPSYSWLGDVPPGFFRPDVLTPARIAGELPGSLYFEVVDILIIVLIIQILIGIKARFAFRLLFMIIIINNSFAYSFGKIDHSIFTPLILLLFSFTNGGTHFAIWPDKKVKTQNLALALFSICLVFAFFTAGYEKALNWIDFDLSTSGILSWFYGGYFNLQRNELLAENFFLAPMWITEIMDYTAVIFEISGIFFLYYSRKSWFSFLIIAAIFHLANTLILNITFINHFVVYGLWLLGPFLLRKKIATLFLVVFLLVKGLYLAVFLWVLLIAISLTSWKKGWYNNNNQN